MDVRATKFFRIKEEKGQKTYVTGDLIENEKTIEWALKHGFAEKRRQVRSSKSQKIRRLRRRKKSPNPVQTHRQKAKL